jgi:type II secretory pathway pseudopilin PulG
MTEGWAQTRNRGFSLVEVVVAIGIVSFAVLATIALLSVGNDANKRAKDEGAAAQLASNEFERLRSLGSASTFWSTHPLAYPPRYFDSNLTDLGTAITTAAVYQLQISFIEGALPGNPPPSNTPPIGTADVVANAEVRYPAHAPAPNQSVYRFTTLMNFPN